MTHDNVITDYVITSKVMMTHQEVTRKTQVMNEFLTVIRPDLVWYDDNVNWLKHLVSSNGTEQKFFLQEMIEKKDLTMLTVDRLPGIDQTFDCWVILAFDSSELQKCKITNIV